MTFSERVYKFTSMIPRGRVSTYGDVARAMGCPGGSRAVGNALNKNPFAPQVPCHRVIRSSGEIGGFNSGSTKKARLLKAEGVEVKDGRIAAAETYYEFKA